MNKELEIALTTYIALKHTQEECIGFIDGFEAAEEIMYSEEDMKQFAEWLIKVNFNYTSNISDLFLIWKKQFNNN
jgi:hypothetical protein